MQRRIGKRGKREQKPEKSGFRYLLYLSGGVLLVIIASFIVTFVSYNNRLRNSSDNLFALEQITENISNDLNNINIRK